MLVSLARDGSAKGKMYAAAAALRSLAEYVEEFGDVEAKAVVAGVNDGGESTTVYATVATGVLTSEWSCDYCSANFATFQDASRHKLVVHRAFADVHAAEVAEVAAARRVAELREQNAELELFAHHPAGI